MSTNGNVGCHRTTGRPSNGKYSKFLGATALATLVTVSAIALSSPVPAVAQQTETEFRSFNIPSQPLGAAVVTFGRQSGLQVSIAAAAASGRKTSPVNGTMDAYAALTAMLSGTGFYWWLSDDGTVIIAASDSGVLSTDPDTLVLDTIIVSSGAGRGYRGTPDWVYDTPDSVSVVTREAIEESGARETNDLFATVSGVYSGSTVGAFPTVSPNVRGLQDSGRVIISIDGARQNAQDAGRYGGSGTASGGFSGSNSVAFVDTAFIREIDITKKTNASANNAGSLSGAVDFRLVGADDIIQPGEIWGAELSVGHGTNAYHFNGSAIGAVRLGENISLTLGASKQEIGLYEPGAYGVVDERVFRFQETDRESLSTLAKLEAEFGDFEASLAWFRQTNKYARLSRSETPGTDFDAISDTAILDVDWNPASSLVDLSGKLWFQSTVMEEYREARSSTPETKIDRDFTSFGVILQNTSDLTTRLGDLNLNYGLEAFRDVADKAASSSSIAQNPLYETGYGGWTPAGRRDIASVFLNGTLDPADWISVSGGIRYDWYRLKGSPTYYYNADIPITGTAGAIQNEYDALYPIFRDILVSGGTDPALVDFILPGFLASQGIFPGGPAGEYVSACQEWFAAGTNYNCSEFRAFQSQSEEIDRSDGAWLPSVTVAFAPVDWFKPYASYSQSFRPPTISESFVTGSITPGDKIGVELAPNTGLRPEKGYTYEIGANIAADSIFLENDSLRVKVSGFYREVDDYIVVGEYLSDVPLQSGQTFLSYVNLDGTARMRGVEIEGAYDTGTFWLGGAYTLVNIDWPQTTERFSNATTSTTGSTIYWNSTVPPAQKFTLDAGVRLFDQRLSLGARVNHVEPTEEARLDSEGTPIVVGDAYTTMDIYGSLKLTENAVLQMTGTNMTDVRYLPMNGTNLAPGRTLQAALKVRF